MTNRVIPLEVKGTVNTIINGKRRRTVEEHEKYVDMRNACYRKRSEKNKSINYFTGFDDGFEQAKKRKSDARTAYIKGIRTMANALKKYDREEGACTDYFEHTVDRVLKSLLEGFGE